jgi:hypothetical protein
VAPVSGELVSKGISLFYGKIQGISAKTGVFGLEALRKTLTAQGVSSAIPYAQ